MDHLKVLVKFLFIIEGIYSSSEGERPLVSIKQGTLKGIKEETTKGKEFYSFMAIPYAKPPIQELRFKDPIPAGSWKGIRDADQDPEYCLQISVMDTYLVTNPVPQGSEDCLYLNVYSSNVERDAELPVMVYFPGGNFIRGGIKDYKPYALLNEDIVLVVVQSRLSIFGYLEIADTPITGNYGLKDGIEALKWIRENIKNFGGDPGRVTIFGHSSGGAYSHILTLSPRAKGLFHGAILQSGFAYSPIKVKNNQVKFNEFLRTVKCDIENENELLECLQRIHTDILYETFIAVMNNGTSQGLLKGNFATPMVFPAIDGNVYPDSGINILRDKSYNPVNLMVGCDRDDASYVTLGMMPPVGSAEGTMMVITGMLTMLLGLPYEDAKGVHDLYFSNENNWNSWNQYFTDIMCGLPMALFSYIENEDSQLKTYLYSFDHRGQYSYTDFIEHDVEEKKNWITHGDELFYLFSKGPIYSRPLEMQDDLQMRDLQTKLWTNFARTGNPTPDDSLGFKWKPISSNDHDRLSITLNPRMEQDKRAEFIDYWLSLHLESIQNLLKERGEALNRTPPNEEL